MSKKVGKGKFGARGKRHKRGGMRHKIGKMCVFGTEYKEYNVFGTEYKEYNVFGTE